MASMKTARMGLKPVAIARSPRVSRQVCKSVQSVVVDNPCTACITAPTWQLGVSQDIGRKVSMEDRHVMMRGAQSLGTSHPLAQYPGPSIAAVFDGHGGQSTVEYVARHLPHEVTRHPVMRSTPEYAFEEEEEDVAAALKSVYLNMDAQMQHLARVDPEGWTGGSTALMAMQRGNTLITANAGDCRAVLCRDGEAHRLTRDHSPNDPQEQFRIRSHGGQLRFKLKGGWRIMGTTCTLGVARGFGDFQFKSPRKLVSPEPDVVGTPLTPSDHYVILGSDGLWSTMSDEEAVEIASQALSECKVVNPNAPYQPTDTWANIAAQSLLDEAIKRGVFDNITAMVILLNWNQNSELFARQRHAMASA